MTDTTPRLGLPLLAPGQAQKEVFHNEALALLDALAQPVVQTLGDDAPPADPASGQAWIVGSAPAGEWAGQAGAVAVWTAGGWRFVTPPEGWRAWVLARSLPVRRADGGWVAGQVTATALTIGGVQVVGAQRPAVTDPAGGTVVDASARAAVAAVLAALRAHGLIAS